MKSRVKLFVGTLVMIIALSIPSAVFAASQAIIVPQADHTPQTPEQLSRVQEKSKLAEEYVQNKRSLIKSSSNTVESSSDLGEVTPDSYGGSKFNYVGHFRQTYKNTCGPTAAKNTISGYTQYNGGNSPSEVTLAQALGVVPDNSTNPSAGAAFDATKWQNTLNTYAPGNNYTLQWGWSGWSSTLTNNVIYTIDKSKNYNVVVNLYHGVSSTAVRPEFANGVRHYVSVYGYHDPVGYYAISDSYSIVPQTYTASYYNTAQSCYQRGIIW